MTFRFLSSNMTAKDKRKMLLILGVFLLLALLITSMLSFFVSKKSIREVIVTSELPLTSDTIYSEIQNDLLKPLFISSTMAHDTFLRDWTLQGEEDVSQIRRYLSEIKEKYGTITSFFVSEQSRNYYYYDGILKTVQESEERDLWYFRVRDMQAPYEINVDLDAANTDAMTVFINYRVLDYKGNFIGTTGVGLTVNMVKQRIDDYRLRFNRNIYFLNAQGNILLNNCGETAENNNGKNIRLLPGIDRIAESILDQESSSFEYKRNGKTVLLNARFLPELKWYLLVEQVESEALTSLYKVLKLNILICLIISIAVMLLINYMIKWFQCRLENRYQELEEKNTEIGQQHLQLEQQAVKLTESNQRLEHLHREKDEWVSIVAHDLKTPLNTILGFSELIADSKLPVANINEYNQFITKSATDMSRLVNNLLDVYEIETMLAVKSKKIDLCALTRETIETVTLQAHLKEITLCTSLPDTPTFISGQAEWVNKIISNLLSNALKFSPEESSVAIELGQEGSRVRLTIGDQGPGLTLEDQQRLFSRFARLSATPTGGEISTGLGLYFVKKITKRMGGDVTCESEPGKGARFIVEFPLFEEPAPPT